MTMQQTPLLLHTLLSRGAHVAPHEAIVNATANGVHRQTYATTSRRARQLANALNDAGIGIGDRVGSFLWNHHRHLEMYQGVTSMGAVLHTINIRLGEDDLEYIINHGGAEIIVVDEDLLPSLEPLAARLAGVRHWIVSSESGEWQSSLPSAVDYETFIGTQSAEFEWPEFDENAPLGLCYTSGTTGRPKGVMYTHRSTYLHSFAEAMTDTMSMSATDSVCAIVPMFHAMAWGLPFTAMMLGAKQVFPNRFMTPSELLDLMVNEEVTLAGGVPTIWQGVRGAIEAQPERWDLSKLDRVLCGGSAPPPSLLRWFRDALDVEMIHCWGMTETNPLAVVSRQVAKRAHRKLDLNAQFKNMGKTGLLVPGLEMKIVDDDFEPLAHDGDVFGDLLVKGPWIAGSYYQDPQPEKFHDGWLMTGDIARIDAEEYLIITDRSKDVIKSGGEWISSVDLENHICALEGVAQAAVVAQPHPKWDERPVALVVRADASSMTAEDVLQHCGAAFAKWQIPDEILFVDQLALTTTGKIDKKTLRARLAAQSYVLPDLR